MPPAVTVNLCEALPSFSCQYIRVYSPGGMSAMAKRPARDQGGRRGDAKYGWSLFRNLHGAGEVMDMWKTITPAANPATFKVEPHLLGTLRPALFEHQGRAGQRPAPSVPGMGANLEVKVLS